MGTEEVAQQKRERLLHDLGRALERDGEAEMACEVLALARHHPATERHARLVYALQGAEAARPLLDRMLEEPDSDEELLFAEDFFGRKYQGMRVGALSTMLREARVLALDESGRDEAEAAAVRWFRQRGGEAWHVENAFWRMLFGLAFWDLLYGAQARLPNEFERWPPTLRDGSFGRVHAAQLAELAERWRQPGGLAAEVERTAARVWGEPNGLFFWDESLLPVLLQWLREENPLVVVKLLRRMA